jgi:hypothetical protein
MEEIELNQEQIEKLIAAGVLEEIAEQEDESSENLRPAILMSVEDRDEDETFELSSIKMPILQVGSVASGHLITEIVVGREYSSYFRSWLDSATVKNVEIKINDNEGNRVETWKMKCLLEGIMWGEVTSKSKDPWTLTAQFSAKSMKTI